MGLKLFFKDIFKKKATVDDVSEVKMLLKETIEAFNAEKHKLKTFISNSQTEMDSMTNRLNSMDEKIAEMDKIYVRKFIEITNKLNNN